jgi:hypothetical protein
MWRHAGFGLPPAWIYWRKRRPPGDWLTSRHPAPTNAYRFLDLIPLGRQRYINEWPWHDTYGAGDDHEHHH